MKILVDTCEFLWYISGDPRLPSVTVASIRDPSNDVFLSVVSLWEIIVKHSLGKLPLPQPPEIFIPAQRQMHRIETLHLDEASVQRLSLLPLHHRDPFDRMIVCQAQSHGMHIASSDPIIARYAVPLLV